MTALDDADGAASTNRHGDEAKGSPRFANAGVATMPPQPTKNDLRPSMYLLLWLRITQTEFGYWPIGIGLHDVRCQR